MPRELLRRAAVRRRAPRHRTLGEPLSPTYPNGDFWRFTPAGIAQLLGRHWPSDFMVKAFGNLRTCMAFLMGEVVEDLPDIVLDHHDPRFPLTAAAEATKSSSPRETPNRRTTI